MCLFGQEKFEIFLNHIGEKQGAMSTKNNEWL